MDNSQQMVMKLTQLVYSVAQQLYDDPYAVPVGISARHVHLSKQALELLFGKGYELTKLKPLSQPGQFAANETVEIIGPKGSIKKVRILGPERKDCQVEISASDARKLGIKAPVRASGDIDGTPGIKIKGPNGEIGISNGVIIAERHIHMSSKDAKWFGVKNGDSVMVSVPGDKGGIMGNVTVRVSDSYMLDMHIDTDDANAFAISQGQMVTLINKRFDSKEI